MALQFEADPSKEEHSETWGRERRVSAEKIAEGIPEKLAAMSLVFGSCFDQLAFGERLTEHWPMDALAAVDTDRDFQCRALRCVRAV